MKKQALFFNYEAIYNTLNIALEVLRTRTNCHASKNKQQMCDSI